MKKVKTVLVIIAIVINLLLLLVINSQLFLLRIDFNKWEVARMERSIALTDIFAEHLKDRNEILKSIARKK